MSPEGRPGPRAASGISKLERLGAGAPVIDPLGLAENDPRLAMVAFLVRDERSGEEWGRCTDPNRGDARGVQMDADREVDECGVR